jgi:uncharacterized membrane protein YhaH (DUF805 family)
MLAVSEKLASTIEKSGEQTYGAIKEGAYVTKVELRRLQIAQDLSMIQMRLANVQSEIRTIERMPRSSVTRNQLRDLRGQEVALQQQAQTLASVLNPTPPASPVAAKPASRQAGLADQNLGAILRDLLFSKQGRISRSQYWLGMFIVMGLLFFAVALSGTSANAGESGSPLATCGGFMLLLSLWTFYAVSAKRYHDHGKSSLWVLIAFIPLVQFWQLLELGFFPGTPGPNKYGSL